jgi:hypothetical protein
VTTVARLVELYTDVERDLPVNKHNSPIRQEDRLIDIMGDKQDRWAMPQANVLQ